MKEEQRSSQPLRFMSPILPRYSTRGVPAVLGAAAALLVAACQPKTGPADRASPGPRLRPDTRYVFYDVEGSTAGELAQSMRRNGPLWNGRRVRGLATWNLRWNARWQNLGGRCAVSALDVRLEAEIRLPRWRQPPDASPELVEHWNRFVRAVAEHEAGHIASQADAARELRNRLRRQSAPTCSLLDVQLRQEANRVIAYYRERDRHYQQSTRGGGTQGAVWPPRELLRFPADTLQADTLPADTGGVAPPPDSAGAGDRNR